MQENMSNFPPTLGYLVPLNFMTIQNQFWSLFKAIIYLSFIVYMVINKGLDLSYFMHTKSTEGVSIWCLRKQSFKYKILNKGKKPKPQINQTKKLYCTATRKGNKNNECYFSHLLFNIFETKRKFTEEYTAVLAQLFGSYYFTLFCLFSSLRSSLIMKYISAKPTTNAATVATKALTP